MLWWLIKVLNNISKMKFSETFSRFLWCFSLKREKREKKCRTIFLWKKGEKIALFSSYKTAKIRIVDENFLIKFLRVAKHNNTNNSLLNHGFLLLFLQVSTYYVCNFRPVNLKRNWSERQLSFPFRYATLWAMPIKMRNVRCVECKETETCWWFFYCRFIGRPVWWLFRLILLNYKVLSRY